MIKRYLCLLLVFFIAVSSYGFDYTPTSTASAIDGSGYDDFSEWFPTGDANILEVQYRSGADRETTAGDIYTLDYNISGDSYGSPTLLFECPTATEDATNPTIGQIGSTLYTLVNCKNTANTDGHLYLASRPVSGDSGDWSAFTEVYDPAYTANGWGPLVPTSDPDTYFWPISVGSAGGAIQQLRTTDGGTTWTGGQSIISSPTYWSEASCQYIPNKRSHICTLRNDNGDYINQITSTDGLGLVWSDPSDTNLGAATGVKLTTLIYDPITNMLLIFFADRDDSIAYAATANPNAVFDDPLAWNEARTVQSGVTTELIAYETNTTTRTFRLMYGSAAGSGGGRLNDLTYRNLFQKLTFGQIGPL